MKEDKFISLNGVSLNASVILSFDSEKEFVKAFELKFWKRLELKERRTNLKAIYKQAKSG